MEILIAPSVIFNASRWYDKSYKRFKIKEIKELVDKIMGASMAKRRVKNTGLRISKYSLAERITYLRKKRNMTQAELAKKAKLSQSTIAQIENEKKDPSMDTVQRLAIALEVHIAVLFSEDNVHVFDMEKLRANYKNVGSLNETLYRALGEVVRFARDIGY